jgi:hypothetical protein
MSRRQFGSDLSHDRRDPNREVGLSDVIAIVDSVGTFERSSSGRLCTRSLTNTHDYENYWVQGSGHAKRKLSSIETYVTNPRRLPVRRNLRLSDIATSNSKK